MKKSHITRIMSAAIKHESIGFVPAVSKFKMLQQMQYSDGDFTAIAFVYDGANFGDLMLAVPKIHSVEFKGSMVATIRGVSKLTHNFR